MFTSFHPIKIVLWFNLNCPDFPPFSRCFRIHFSVFILSANQFMLYETPNFFFFQPVFLLYATLLCFQPISFMLYFSVYLLSASVF